MSIEEQDRMRWGIRGDVLNVSRNAIVKYQVMPERQPDGSRMASIE